MQVSAAASRRRGKIATLVLGFALLPCAAAAETPTRTAYVAELEKVCKRDSLLTQRVTKGALDDVKAERIAVAAAKFAKAEAIFGSTVDEIAAVERPLPDETRLEKWFGYLEKQESYLRQMTRQLRADRTIKAQRLLSRFIHNGNLANNVVLAFGFDYCRFKFSRYE
jgi:hypothetical protein